MENIFKGIDRGMNVAVLRLASRLFPCGFDVKPEGEAPSSLETLTECIKGGRLAVSGDNCEGTAFGDVEVNLAFRAWHDWTHWRYQLPFTLSGETATAHMQVQALKDVGLWNPFREAFILAEVVDQAQHYADTGAFPKDQFKMTLRGILSRIPSRDPAIPHLLRLLKERGA